MDYQLVLNAAFGIISFLGGWLLKITFSQITRIREDYDELYDASKQDYRGLQNYHEEDLKEVRKEISELALSLPEKYVAKQDLDKLIDFINERFNKLESKIDDLKT